MNEQQEYLQRLYNEARTKLFNLKAGKHNGAEQAYGKAYDNLAKHGYEMRLKEKYR
jgi:hypothetical protein